MTDPSAAALGQLAMAYANAWNSADVDAILALSTNDTTFHLHDGHPAVHGVNAVGEAIREFFSQWSDVSFARRGVFFGKDAWVVEWTLTARSRVAGGIGATGVAVSCEGVDVVTARDGRIAAKHVYYDGVTVAKLVAAAGG